MDIQFDWQGGYKFSGTSMWGHTLTTDASKKGGGEESGYQPLELLIFGLAGCTGVDIVMIANKMCQEMTGLSIKVKAEQREECPRAFTKLHIEYIFKGRNLDRHKLGQAIELSEKKYCSASATLAGTAEITHSYTILEEE